MKKITALLLAMIMSLALLTGCGQDGGDAAGEKGTLYVYCFGDYFDPQLEYQFEEETGYDVVVDLFDTNEEMYPVIKNNTAQYDVICASDYMIERLISEDLLAEINYDNVPNAANVADNIKPFMEGFDPGMVHSLPHTWGTYGIMYNTEMVNGEIDSWEDLWDPQYEGQIVMPNSMREGFMIGAKLLGYSMNTTSEEEISAITDKLIEQKPLVYSFDNDSAREKMIGDSAALAVITSGEVLYSKEYNENLEYVIPEEGTEVWTDCWAIPKTAQNKDGAEAWMNFMLDGDVAAANFEYLTYAIPNTQIADLVDEPVLNPTEEELASCETLRNLGAEVDDMYSSYWKIYRAE
ncbi:MAG: ABC transporter substrate-binding protein [Anaerovoracaceae bacterium]|nr:ABC transporter substrate-binding protein [Anaerovoracaceae bacterium]